MAGCGMKGLVCFPRAGITCADMRKALGITQAAASVRLGLHRSTILDAAKRYGFADQFKDGRMNKPPSGLCVSRQDIIECRGMLKTDAAAVLGVSVSVVRKAAKRYGCNHLFPARGGEAWWVAKRGYA